MKLTIQKLLFVSICITIFCSCVYNVDSYLSSFESFVESVEQKSEITDSEYTEIKKDYLDYSESYYYKYESKLSSEQKSKINELKLRYYQVIGANHINDIVDDLEDLGSKAVDMLNKFLE